MGSQSADELLGSDHAALNKLFTTVLAALDQGETSAVFERLDLFWARLAMHIRAEHLHLFPAILSGLKDNPTELNGLPSPADVSSAIAQLRADHDFFMHELAAAIKTMRRLKDSAERDVGGRSMNGIRASIIAIGVRLESHNQIEEDLVYGLPAKVLTSSEQRNLTAGIERELQNLPPRFSACQ